MKSKIKLIHVLALLFCGTLFLSSCGSLKDQFSHQRYTHFKVKHNGNYAKEELSTTTSTPVKEKNREVSAEGSGTSVTTASSEVKETNSELKTVTHQNNLSAETKKQRSTIKLENKMNFKKFFAPVVMENKERGGDVNSILLILLCIFIPPLACYMKDDTVSTAFWATLILCLLTFSVFIFYYGGFLWVIAMIIAFVHCFT